MLPVLLDLGFLKIYTFGVFLALAFFWGCFLLWRNIRLTSFKEELVFDGLFLSLFSGLFFGRLVYVMVYFSDFGFDIMKFILMNGYPGFSLYGGIFGMLLGFVLYFRRHKIKSLELIDYIVPPVLMVLAIGKIGSFFSGAEVGSQTKFFLSMRYANFDGFRHLTAFYEALVFFIGAFLTYRILYGIRREKYKKGVLLYYFIWFFSAAYFVFDWLKEDRFMIQGISIQQVVSLVLLLTSSGLILYYMRNLVIKGVVSVKNGIINHAKKNSTSVHPKTKEDTSSV